MFYLVPVFEENCSHSGRDLGLLTVCLHAGASVLLTGSPTGMDPELGALSSLLPLSILFLLGTFVTLGPASPALGRKAACRGLRPGAVPPAMGLGPVGTEKGSCSRGQPGPAVKVSALRHAGGC